MNSRTLPVIGITPESVQLARADGAGSFLSRSLASAVIAAGGVPMLLPLTREPALLEASLAVCDGLILAGGGDPAESSGAYGRPLTAAERQTLGGVEPLRDHMELFLARQVLAQDRPCLGICRGLQMLNQALGGTLAAHRDGHRHPDPWQLAHPVTWEPGTGFAALGLTGLSQVNSTHHQVLDRVAEPLRVAARAPDGVVEAAELPGARFCRAVQFHPERLLAIAPGWGRLFAALVAACQRD